MSRQMKDSGIEWIGEIPEAWNIISFWQAIERMATGLNPRDNFELTKEDELFYVTIRNFKDGKLFLDDNCDRISIDAWNIIQERSQLKKGDIIFASISKDGQAYILEDEPNNWNINESVFCIRIDRNRFNEKYFYYHLIDDAFYSDLRMDATGSTFQSIKQNKLRKSRMVMPSIDEQKRIADFLDQQCAHIDAVIEKTKASIEEYKKLKQAVITQAVSKGIRGDRPMKDNGNGIVKSIPEGWEYRKVKTFISMPVIDGPHESPELFDEGIPYVSATAVINGKIDFGLIRGFISKEYSEICNQRYRPQTNDILIIKLGASTGQVAIVEEETNFNIWVPLAAIRCTDEVLARFIFYGFQADYLIRQMELSWTFGTQQTLGVKTIEQLKFLVPNIEEQQEIVFYLDKKCSEIDVLIENKEKFLTELEAYKKSLIYEYVTGKKEVPVS